MKKKFLGQQRESGKEVKAQNQNSSGVLKDEVALSPFGTVARIIGDLAIDEIRYYDGIPDYVKPADVERPIVVSTPEGYFCLEAWDLVEAARAAGKSSILCDVDHIAEHSDIELGIRKSASRDKTLGGDAAYMERSRNCNYLYEMLLSSNSNLRVFSHGGRRRGEGFVNNREEDAIHVLTLRLGKKNRDTVNAYRHHIKHLSDDAIRFFIENNATKKFFEDAQRKKKSFLRMLEEKRLDSIEMTEQVSAFMMDLFAEYHPKDKAEKKRSQAAASRVESVDSVVAECIPPLTEEGDDAEDIQSDDIEDGVTSAEPINDVKTDQSITIEIIKTATLDLARRLAENMRTIASVKEIENYLKQETANLLRIMRQVQVLANREA